MPGTDPEPDYKALSIDELHGVLRHIDGHRYPERLARLRDEIALRDAEYPESDPAPREVPLHVLAALRGAYWFVCLNAAVLVVAQVGIAAFTGFREAAFMIFIQLPGSSQEASTVASWIATVVVTILLAIGVLSWRYKRHPFVAILGAGFLALSVRLELGGFVWSPEGWPSRFSVNFWVGSWELGVLVVPAVLMTWVVLLESHSGVDADESPSWNQNDR